MVNQSHLVVSTIIYKQIVNMKMKNSVPVQGQQKVPEGMIA